MSAPMLSLHIPGKPIAFARARTHGKQHYTPEPQASYMAAVSAIGRAAMGRAGYKPFEGPVEVIYRATFSWPASWSQKRRDAIRWKTSKPDVDNAAKICSDALNTIAYRDDAQVVRLHAEKVYGELEGVVVTVTPLSQEVEVSL